MNQLTTNLKKWAERTFLPHRAEDRLAKLRLTSLLDATAYIVWIADKRGIITTEGGKQWRTLVGMPNNIPNDHWEDFCIHPDDIGSIRDAWAVAKRTRTRYTIQYRLHIKDSIGYRYFQRTAVPVIDTDDELIEWMGVCMDVTERRIYEDRLQDEVRKAEAANKSKTEFLAVMSHELRTPLTAVIGFGELLNDEVLGPVTQEQKDAITRIQLSGTHLIGMIDQILNFSAIEAGNFTVSLEVVTLYKLLNQVIDFMQPIAEQRGIELRCNCSKSIILNTDPAKLRQIVVNLVGNAIKFTPEGTIFVTCSERVDDGFVLIRVEDTGIGIPQEYQTKVFEKFWQVKQGLTRNVGGAGLGLAIVKKFSELLGGEVFLNSIPKSDVTIRKHGSTFTVQLPKNLPQVAVEKSLILLDATHPTGS